MPLPVIMLFLQSWVLKSAAEDGGCLQGLFCHFNPEFKYSVVSKDGVTKPSMLGDPRVFSENMWPTVIQFSPLQISSFVCYA